MGLFTYALFGKWEWPNNFLPFLHIKKKKSCFKIPEQNFTLKYGIYLKIAVKMCEEKAFINKIQMCISAKARIE